MIKLAKKVFRTRYRVIKSRELGWGEVEIEKRWFWSPFWFYVCSEDSLGKAKKTIEELKNGDALYSE